MKIVFVVNELSFFESHRLPLATAMEQQGAQVHIVFGTRGSAVVGAPEWERYSLHYIRLARSGLNPLGDMWFLLRLWLLLCEVRPNLVHLISLKPVVYGSIAARLSRVPAVVSAITGLGSVFANGAFGRASFLTRFVRLLLTASMRHPNQRVILQNTADRDFCETLLKGHVGGTSVISGSGVSLREFVFTKEPLGVPVVVMASRLLRQKGVFEFVEAARLLRLNGVGARFWLVGAPDRESPSSITVGQMVLWRDEGIVEVLGYRSDVSRLYTQASVVVLPSFYGEGLPRTLQEAAACGRAIVTTDLPGCRDAVVPGVTGLVVPPRDARALADAIERLLKDHKLRRSMGAAGRELAEREFSIERVVAAHMQIYKGLLAI